MALAPGAINTGDGSQQTIRFVGRSRDDNNWTFDGVDATGVKDPGQEAALRLVISTDGTGYIVCTDQIEGNAEYHVYRREGDHSLVTVIRGGADSTDGLEIRSTPLGPQFPQGLMIAMNSKDRNFLVYRWPESLR